MSNSRNNLSKQQNPDMVAECASSGGVSRTAYGYDSRKAGEDSKLYKQPSHMLSHKETTVLPSSPNTSDKYLYDSGCISGALTSEQSISSSCDLSSSSNILSSGSIKEKNYTDSGFLEENSMRLDSGECGNLSEHFSELNLKSHLNDLNAAPRTISTSDSSRTSNIISPSSKPTQVVSTPAPSIQQQQQQSQIDAHFDYQYFVQDEDGDTQLHLAILQGFIEVVYGLIRMAPEPNWLDVPNDLHQTPMHLAVLTAQAPIVRALLVAGASPDSRDRHGNTPLHLASMHGATDCVRALLQPIAVSETLAAGLRYNPAAMLINNTAAIIDEPNYDGQLCVHLAAAEGHVDALRHLVWSGADINGREGKLGRTPLHVAAERGRRRISLYLLQECPAVDLTLVTFAGYTAYQLAQYGDPTLARELANRGAAIRAHLDSSSSEESDSEEEEIFGHLPTEGFYRRAIVA